MALGNLQSAIEKLQKTIEAHRGYLTENETRTRQVLIDPLLRKLGWDVSNPNIVQLEYRVQEQWADYVLMSKGKPVAVVEAKRLRSDLGDDQIMQALNYANADGIPYMIIANGDTWEMYDVFKPATLEERLLMKLELSQQPARKNAEQALAMRKPNLTAKEPVFKRPKRASKRNKSPKPSKPLGRKWYSFDSDEWYPQHTKPSELRIGNHPGKGVTHWLDVVHEIVTWLIDEGMLSDNDCPIEIGKWPFISRKAVNPDGTPFDNPQELPNSLILQRGGLTTEQQFSRLRKLLIQFDVPLSTIRCRLTGQASR